MNKLNSINITFDANDEIKINVRFKDVDVELRDSGFVFNSHRSEINTLAYNSKFKLIKEDEYILLKNDRDANVIQKGTKSLQSGKRSGYQYYYPHYTSQAIATIERYGSNFRLEKEGESIKLHPILIDETKQITKEILIGIARYETEKQ